MESLEYVSFSENHLLCLYDFNAGEYNGYFNLGNTCYINSCLIVLFHFFEFRELLETAATLLRPLRQPDQNNEGFLLDQLIAMFNALSSSDPELIANVATNFCQFLDKKSSFRQLFSEHHQINIKSNVNASSRPKKGTDKSNSDISSKSQKETEISIANTQNDARNFFEYILDEILDEINIPLGNLNLAENMKNLMYYHTCNVFPSYSNNNPPYPVASLGLSLSSTNLLECIEDFFKNEIIHLEK